MVNHIEACQDGVSRLERMSFKRRSLARPDTAASSKDVFWGATGVAGTHIVGANIESALRLGPLFTELELPPLSTAMLPMIFTDQGLWSMPWTSSAVTPAYTLPPGGA
jgi:hypothetical protein